MQGQSDLDEYAGRVLHVEVVPRDVQEMLEAEAEEVKTRRKTVHMLSARGIHLCGAITGAPYAVGSCCSTDWTRVSCRKCLKLKKK